MHFASDIQLNAIKEQSHLNKGNRPALALSSSSSIIWLWIYGFPLDQHLLHLCTTAGWGLQR